MAAIERQRIRPRNGERHSRARARVKQFDVTSVCDVVGLSESGLRRSARLKEKLAAHSGRAEEFRRLGKRNWEGRKSQHRLVSEGPGSKKFKATRKVNRGQRRSMDHVAVGESHLQVGGSSIKVELA